MKFVTVIFVAAFLCVAVVSATPSTEPSTLSPLSRAKCIIAAVKTSVQAGELQDMVKEFLNLIRTIAKKEVKCTIAARFHIPKIIKCQLKASADYFEATSRFSIEIAQKNAGSAVKLVNGVPKCLFKPKPKPEFELFKSAGNKKDVTKYLKGVKCVLNFFDHTLKGSKFDQIYENVKPVIVMVAKNMEDCIREKSGTEQRKCVEGQAITATDMMENITNNITDLDQKAGEEIIEELNEACEWKGPKTGPGDTR